MSPASRPAKAFAIMAALVMLLMVANSTVVNLAFAGPVVSPAVDVNNNTTPPPPSGVPIPPPDAPQRPVEPGTITQGWDNSSPVSPIQDQREVTLLNATNGTTYETTYGYFALNQSAPYFVSVLSPDGTGLTIADSAFLVSFQGQLLQPANGVIDKATSGELDFHYGLYLNLSLQGTMTVDYRFLRAENNITVSFAPLAGIPSSQFQIVWLTFTMFDIVDTAYPADSEQRIEDLDGAYGSIFFGLTIGTVYATGTQGTVVKPSKGASSNKAADGLHLDVSDAPNDVGLTYAGKLNFTGHSGNAVLTTFMPGHLSIDPQLLYSSQLQDATSFSGSQRKTFYDGERYWIFWKVTLGSPTYDQIDYKSSPDGKNWGYVQAAVTLASGNHLTYNFDVANYGKTVAVTWVDSSVLTDIQIKTGLIAADAVQWDSSRSLYHAGTFRTINKPAAATFIGPSQIAVTWVELDGAALQEYPYFERVTCTGQGTTGSSICATLAANQLDAGNLHSVSDGGLFTLPVAFLGTGTAARVTIYPSIAEGQTHVYIKIFNSDGTTTCGDTQVALTGAYESEWINSGLFTATASFGHPVGGTLRNIVSVFLSYRANNQILSYDVDPGCNSWSDVTQPTGGVPALYLSAGTEISGSAEYLFYTTNGITTYARIIPSLLYTWTAIQALPSADANVYYTTAAQFSSRFIPLMFTRAADGLDGCNTNWCLYYVNYPLPLDGESAVDNPWSTKLGVPFLTDTGGVTNPSTGLLANGQVLVGGNPAISIIYREPGLFKWDGSKDVKYTANDERYQIIPGIYYDLPWVPWSGNGELHMQGGQKFLLSITGTTSAGAWFNNTAGIRYTLYSNNADSNWYLSLPSGAYMVFNIGGDLTKTYLDLTGNNYVTYALTTDSNHKVTGGTITGASGRVITFTSNGLTYGNGQAITLTSTSGSFTGCSDGTSTDSGTLQVVDAIGRSTTYYVCHWKLSKITSPNGGEADYAFATYNANPGQGNQVWQGTEAYSLPLTRMDILNESGAQIKARSLVFSWTFQNGEVTRALVNTTDKGGVVQGTNEYAFNAAMGTASVRAYDSAGQVIYFDMQTLSGTNMKDLSGNANDGTVSGPIDAFGRYGRSRDFSGSSQWIETASSMSSLSMTDFATVSLWFQHDYAGTFPLNDVKGLFFKGANTGFCERNYEGSLTTTGALSISWDNCSSIDSLATTTTYTDSSWHHMVGVFNWNAQYFAIYVDGALAASKSSSVPVTATTAKLVLGKVSETSGVNRFFNGRLDEFRIFHRALSPEDVGALYTKNALKRGEQANWYSINDMPHLAEGFLGDETSPSVVTSDAIDDWGNQIYRKDATGNETFASYANTNHQNHFYAPGNLTKSTNTLFDTDFVDFSGGLFPTGAGIWNVVSGGPIQLDYAQFSKITPSLKVPATSSQAAQLDYLPPLTQVTGMPRFIEFRARVGTAAQDFEVWMQKSTNVKLAGMQFTTANTIQMFNGASGFWNACTYPGGATVTYIPNVWYRFTFEFNREGTNIPWKAYLNGFDLSCGTLQVLDSSAFSKYTFYEAASSTATAWIDDIKTYNNANGVVTGYSALMVAFSGLQPRQSIQLVSEDGSIIDQGQWQTGYSNIFLSFNPVPGGVIPGPAPSGAYSYYENGDNAKTTVRIYSEDGALEYQSPLTRFFVGERYTYTRPRTFADELVKSRSGALYWTNPIYADEFGFCNAPIICSSGWTWREADGAGTQTSGAVRGIFDHVTPFDYGTRGQTFTLASPLPSVPNYFITYVRIPSGKAPDWIELEFHRASPTSTYAWRTWGSSGIGNMGPLPSVRDQWVQLVVKSTDLGFVPGTDTWDLIGYWAGGGEVEWDVTTTQTDASLTVSGLSAIAGSGLTVGVYYANNGTLIATGSQSADTATLLLYNKARGITAFPVQVNIKIYDANNEYYLGPLRNVWPGDTFRYVGTSSFFDSKSSGTTYWPSSSIHSAQIGAKKFSGDCLDAVLCYDMETMTEGATSPDSGAVAVQPLDLSGKGHSGVLASAINGNFPSISVIGDGAAGLALTFAASKQTYVSVADNSDLNFGIGDFAVSLWFKASSFTPGRATLIGKYGASAYWVIQLDDVTHKVLAMTVNGPSNRILTSTTVVSLGTLYQISFTRVAGTATLYINGIQEDSGSSTQDVSTTTYALIIGKDAINGGNDQFFDGTLDQILVYKKALTATQILALYQTRLPGAPQTYLRPNDKGFPVTSRVPYEGTYLAAAATYDAKGNVRTVMDTGLPRTLFYDMSTCLVMPCAGGGIMVDLSSNGNNGAITGTTSAAGNLGDARSFNGVGDVITATDIPMQFTAVFTFSAWIKTTSLAHHNTVLRKIGGGATLQGYLLRVTTTGALNVEVWNANVATTWSTAAGVITTGTFFNVAFTYSSGNGQFYVNGLAVSSTKTGTGTSAGIASGNLLIGKDECGCGEAFQGVIDEVQVISQALSAAQVVSDLYNSGTATSYVYSTVDGQDYQTQVNRPDGKQIYYAYDFQSGVKYGTLDIDCRRSRTQYDAMGRPTQTSIYDTDANEVLHLDMETATYNSLKDVSCAGTTDSRNGYVISGVSGTSEVSGVEGIARSFNGVSSQLLTSTTVLSGVTTSVTISAWVNGVTTSSKGAFVKVSASSSTNEGYGLGVGSGTWDLAGNHLIGLYEGVRWIDTGTSIPTGWHHVAMVIDLSGVPSFYIDGRSLGAFSGTGPLPPTNPTAIGGYTAAGSHARFFAGTIDEVRIFNVARSATEIASLWGLSYKLLTRSSVAFDDMTDFVAGGGFSGNWAGYQFADVTSYDGVSLPRSLFFDMQTTKFSGVTGITDALEDLSGNGNHGALQGTVGKPSFQTGKIGKALQFTASNSQWVDVSTVHTNLNLTGPMTVAAWINPSGTGSIDPIFAKGYATSLQYYMDVHKSGSKWYLGIQLKNTAGTTVAVNSAVSIPTGTWTHVAFTYDGNSIKLYINGALDTNTGTIGWPLATSIYDATVGTYPNSPTTYFYDGLIDELHVLPVAPSASQMSDLYNGLEKSHMTKTYQDGLGRTTRTVVMDMFGTKITTVATLNWNDRPIYSYLPSGAYFTYTYDFLGRTLTTQTPGDSTISGISRTIVSDKARIIESVDAVGRKGYQKTDVLGRTVETGIWNPSTSAYGNLTSITYNALSEVTIGKDAKGQTTTTYYNSLGKPKMTVFPDSTDADKRYSLVYYDDGLRAYQTVDVMGRVLVSAYDSLGRVTSVTLKPSLGTSCAGTPNPCIVAYTYDSVHDDLKTIDNGTAKITRGYDSLHRIVAEQLEVPAGTVIGTIGYGYDATGKILNITYPVSGLPQAIYTYDSLGRTMQVDYAGSKYAELSYDSFSRLASIYYWQGATNTTLQEKYTYDVRDRVTQNKVFDTGSTYMQLDYTYSKASEIVGSTDNMYVSDSGSNGVSNPKTITYSYDANGRLAQAVGPFGGSQYQSTLNYLYDQVGNLQNFFVNTTNYVYGYGASPAWNRLDSFTYNSMSFTYNTAGSMLTKLESGTTTTYTHDFLQQLVKVVVGSNTYTYSYDGIGRRIKSYDGTTTSYFMYAGSKMLYSKAIGGSTTETAFVYVGNNLLLRKEGTGSTPEARYYHPDISGNVRLITYYKASNPNKGINVDAKYRYRPFGDIITLATPGTDPRFKFASQEFDSGKNNNDVRLYHMGARYHDPVVGRFIERDPIGPGYSYASNNPISFRDPTGMTTWWGDVVNFFNTPNGRTTLYLVTAVVAVALAPESGGASLILLAGLVTGAIFVAYTYVSSGGRATFDDYYAAFTLGFVVGTTIASVYQSFRVAGEAAMAKSAAGIGGRVKNAALRAESRALLREGPSESTELIKGIREGEVRAFHRFVPSEPWRPGPPQLTEIREIEVSLADFRLVGKGAGEVTEEAVAGATNVRNARSTYFLGSMQSESVATGRAFQEVFVETDIHETLHAAIIREVGDHPESLVDELAKWIVGA